MFKTLFVLFSLPIVLLAASPIQTVDFEDFVSPDTLPSGWEYFGSERSVGVSLDYAHGGKRSLKIIDPSEKRAVGLRTPRIAAEADRDYLVEFWYFSEDGRGMSVYLEFWDAAGKRISASSFPAGCRKGWMRGRGRAVAPAKTVAVGVLFYSHSGNTGIGYFDDACLFSAAPSKLSKRIPYPPAEVKHPCGLYKTADIERAKRNIEKHGWARNVLQSFRNQAQFWMKAPPETFSYWIPELSPFRVVDCPKCGAGWRFAWTGGYDKLVCKNCDFTWPHPDYVETEKETFPDPVGGQQTISYYKGKPSTVYGSSEKEVYRLSALLRHRRLGKLSSLGSLGKVYALTGEKAYAERVRLVLLRLAETYPHYLPHNWTHIFPDYRNLQSGKLSGWKLSDAGIFVHLTTAYDLTYNSGVYSEADKVKIEEGCFREFARLMVATSPRGCCVNDGPTAMAGGSLAGLMLGNHEVISWAIDPPNGFIGFLQDYFRRDGHWYEASASYEGMSVNPLYYTPEALRGYSDPASYAEPDRYDNLDLFKIPVMKKLLLASGYEIMPDGRLPASNDSTWKAGFSSRRVEKQAYWYPGAESASILAWRLNGDENTGTNEYTLFRRDPDFDMAKITPRNLSAESVIRPGVGWGILRSGSSREDVAVFLDYGHKGSGHGHPDRLNIIYYDYGTELVTDMGYLGWGHPNHPWIRSTASHNQVIIDGKPHGNAGGELEAFDGSGPVRGLIASSPKTYPGIAETLRRHLVLVDHGVGQRYLVDLFEVEGGSDHQYSFHGDGESFTTDELPFTSIDSSELGEEATGYKFMKNVEQAASDETITCRWTSNPDEKLGVRLQMLGEAGTRLVRAEANGLRDRKTPFAKVKMVPILIRRKGPENRFLGVIDAFKGESQAVESVRRLETKTAKGWADAVEITNGSRRDVVVFASAEAATAGVELPALPQFRCHARVGFLSRVGERLDKLWLLDGTSIQFRDVRIDTPGAATVEIAEVDAEGAKLALKTELPSGYRFDGQHLFVEERADGAYLLAGGEGKHLELGDEPIIDLSPGERGRLVSAAGLFAIAPDAFRLIGDVRSWSGDSLVAGRKIWMRSPGEDWQVTSTGQMGRNREGWVAFSDRDLAADSSAPVITLPAAAKNGDLGYQSDCREIRFAVRDDVPLRQEQASAILSGDKSGSLPVRIRFDGETFYTCIMPEKLALDFYTLTFTVKDQALNSSTCELRFNTIGIVIPFQYLDVPASSGGDLKYFANLDTRFYRTKKAGDWVEFAFDVAEAGMYEVHVVYTKFNGYGILQASLDGKKSGAPFDLYHPELIASGGTAALGKHQLTAGLHRLRFTSQGKNPKAKAAMTGLCRIVLCPIGK